MSARGEAMVTARRLDSQLKHQRVAAAAEARLAAGQELSIAAVARQAGVSRKFIYAHPDLRAQIEQRAQRHSQRATAAAVADGQVTVASLRADLANAKAHNHRLRGQLRAVEQRLSEALGRDVADELDAGSERPYELRRELQDAQAQIFELTEALADAREELDAVREIDRELLADRNRPAA
jgi:predicted RNase H-like nuclease (RuvC/YqgF family)